MNDQKNKGKTVVRHATKDDAERVFELIAALAAHHGQTEFVLTDSAEIRRAGFGDEPKFGALLAESGDTVVGFLSYTIRYSIWVGDSYMQIDDVFVRPSYRGNGIGEKLMLESRKHAENLGVRCLKWEVDTNNSSAIRFYKRIGATYYEKGVLRWETSTG